MSIESMVAALKVQGITPTSKLVLIGVANHDGDGGAWPSIDTLASYASVTPRQVQKIIAGLVDAGLLRVDVNAGGNTRTRADRRPNLYRLTLDGASSATPRDETSPTTPRTLHGVSSSAPRGVTQRADGVSPTTPETSSKHPEPSAVFETFWSKYPRRVGKPAAKRAFEAAVKRDGLDPIRAGFKTWANWWAANQIEQQFIPHPATWLAQRRYDDSPAPIQVATRRTSKPASVTDLADFAFGKAGM